MWTVAARAAASTLPPRWVVEVHASGRVACGRDRGNARCMDEDLRAELIRWIAEDDETRERLARDGSLFDGYHPEMEAVHRRNAARLREVLARVGWPGRALVGDDGASAAWRIVQHAIGEPELLRGCL
jgi:hypothetical protein